MKVDLVFPASSRPEFTAASLAALRENTDWSLVRSMAIYHDGTPSAGMRAITDSWYDEHSGKSFDMSVSDRTHGGPVGIMNAWLADTAYYDPGGLVMAKIDNDVIVPPGWLNAAVEVMENHPGLDLLGLEPPLSRTPAPWALWDMTAPEMDRRKHVVVGTTGYARCDAIGGVGLMRRRAFATRERMTPHSTYGGFTDWQQRNADVVKGWIVPPLALFLLDRLPVEPWATLSRQYIAEKTQRPWTNYSPADHALWGWWLASTLPRV